MRTEQYSRTERLLGREALERLHGAKVTVVGLGAVGSVALEALARAGVLSFRLVDADTISPTNINRQILATWDTVGRKKCEVAKERILSINRECRVEAMDLFLSSENMGLVMDGTSDLTLDAIDSVREKCDLLTYAYAHGEEIISSMGAALRKNPFLVRSADLMDSEGCPLARRVRQELRKRGVGRGIKVVYSPESVDFAYREAKDDGEAENNRRVLGSLVTITGIFGLQLAHLAIETLTET